MAAEYEQTQSTQAPNHGAFAAYGILQKARKNGRFTGLDFIRNLTTEFMELHGDRRFADDPAIVGGVARLLGMPITVIAHEKGGDLNDKARRNFGSAHPEGYRKALRLMKQAEKFKRPVLCIVDTAGAFCGIGAEARGEGSAIAENLMEMMTLRTPILSLFIGEGGSGGALALAVADQVWMLDNSVYSVISPEGCASILWKDAGKVKEGCECLRMTAPHNLEPGAYARINSETEEHSERGTNGPHHAGDGGTRRDVFSSPAGIFQRIPEAEGSFSRGPRPDPLPEIP